MRTPAGRPDYTPIEEYAVIGDCRSAALVSRDGSLDWLCLPTFDSPSFFAALLDRERGGCFSVRPAGRYRVERRYVPDTNVLQTTFTTSSGRMRLTDLMPVSSEADKSAELEPEREILRLVECLDGEVEVEVECDPRPDYARVEPRLVARGELGFCYGNGGEALYLRSEIPLATRPDGPGTSGAETLAAGERRWIGLTYTDEDPAVLPAFGAVAEEKLARSVRWWSDWAARCRYEGPYREAVVRSALTLKLLTYAPSGAVVAAPTTSLPESLGGVRNWDYRYSWLRDSSLTLQSLIDLGYEREATAFLAWTLHSTRPSWPELSVVYDIHGRVHLREQELDHLEGYAGSRPVRVGNGAVDQIQLDIYGEVADAVIEFVHRGGTLDRQTSRMLVGLGETACRRWQDPDEGIWEIRARRRHHTFSKAMCWVALDRLITLHEEGHIDAPVEKFREHRGRIRELVETRGWSEELGSYVSVLDGDDVDASLLLLGRYLYVEPDSERMRRTCRRIHERLAAGALLYRYRAHEDGLPPGEGAFGIASFWGVDCRCRQGEVEASVTTFEELLGYANDVGLYAEEIDPESGRHLGNFPQAFTHVGLIDTALTLAEWTGQPVGHGAGRAESLDVEAG
ncbi:MAG TPA: glycoside hydrolase family 15 protein [Gemmatimonadota bacterium]|nr:glycoside hydrolase family 15 protein [Gemmatimonadota bacterium]